MARACGQLEVEEEGGVVWLWLRVMCCHATGRLGHHSTVSGSWLQVAAQRISTHAAASAAHQHAAQVSHSANIAASQAK